MRRYLLAWLASVLTVVGLVAAFNLLVDPYGLFRIVRVEGFNAFKARAAVRGALYKQLAAQRMRPHGLILGNSRAEYGLDPDAPAWPADARPVLNFALPGAGIVAALDRLEDTLAHTAPTTLVIGLEFLDFRARSDAGSYPAPPRTPASLRQQIRDRATALLTLDALLDSIATVAAQYDPYPTGLTDAGFNPMRDYLRIARRDGYHMLFRQRDQENARAYLQGPKNILRVDGRPAAEFEVLARIVRLCRARGITTHLVVYPYHAHTLVLFQRTGLWPAFESWKRAVVELLQSNVGDAIPLWDFSGVSHYSAETVPPAGDRSTAMQWYWEAGHFKQALGDLVLGRLFGPAGDGWGTRLTTANVDAVLARQREALAEYETTHPRDIAELDAIVAAASSQQ